MAYDVNTDLILGDKLFLFVDETPIAFSTSASLEVTANTIETSNKMSGKWTSVLAGQSSFTVSTEALYTNKTGHTSFDALMKKMLAQNAIDFVFGTATDETFELSKGMYKGKAFITSLSLNSDNGAVASCSITLTGSGALSEVITA
jgi:predicted secreted protein